MKIRTYLSTLVAAVSILGGSVTFDSFNPHANAAGNVSVLGPQVTSDRVLPVTPTPIPLTENSTDFINFYRYRHNMQLVQKTYAMDNTAACIISSIAPAQQQNQNLVYYTDGDMTVAYAHVEYPDIVLDKDGKVDGAASMLNPRTAILKKVVQTNQNLLLNRAHSEYGISTSAYDNNGVFVCLVIK
ncbi:MAG: hypothetical protein LBT80_04390 [Lactobacillaceae bacterium]|jgi:hypothetical protein|nr:hypothetical protein [Lactobacillaceae bacterium]